ncbi:GGDEF domain-containing protein [Pseudogulbenkiania sp. MAI-1]|uniref:GGDEF domain-containing protein n=1 Tax=Pseudogulbenkiania sp. MAI-1 TaxID=990370 RepID=UPI00045E9ABE|nr:GGDEF domain-containing protein [Pseudogulbenkiania sp. MAI-1]
MSACDLSLCHQLDVIINERRLLPVFQPIVDMEEGSILGYEGLIRGPSNSPLHSPVSLFAAAEQCRSLVALDRACRRVTAEAFVEHQLPGCLFLNISPQALLAPEHKPGETLAYLNMLGLPSECIVIELTETHPDASYQALREAASHYRNSGFRIALDDLGEGFSNMRLWSELRPDVVKLDKHFVQDIQHDPLKEQFVRSMVDIARQSGALLVAEGIETVAELRVLRRLGVRYGQGYLFARPAPLPAREVPSEVRSLLYADARERLGGPRQAIARDLLVEVMPLEQTVANEVAYRLFAESPERFAIPVVNEGVPVGLLRRHDFLESFSRPFNRELYGKKPCRTLMDKEPLIVGAEMGVQELSSLVVAAERRHLIDGFIITENGRYLGMGTGFDLMRKITEMQISAARYANPLTGLPGNVPISESIDRLLDSGEPFVVAYADLDHFKPFNDLYGYAAGDDLIRLLGNLLQQVADPARDLVGHIGGDDFVLLMQSEGWEARLMEVIASFDRQVQAHFDEVHRETNGFEVTARNGELAFFPLTSVSIGVLPAGSGQFLSHHEVSLAVADAKKMAKKQLGSSLFIERRGRGKP